MLAFRCQRSTSDTLEVAATDDQADEDDGDDDDGNSGTIVPAR